jgi:hypothetical protein
LLRQQGPGRDIDIKWNGSQFLGKDDKQRRAANRKTLIVLALIALAFYIGIMISMALR